ncbi:DUF4329 domain-containing protein [Entomospira entomophila]|uniref:DUF4329 domain-containing protein n=1 Tax=Entomospira entomophila TaxID=2719988 RepID=A0A968GAH5_9SPIO|nr:DUF4329 domain-containing protein [Entomospira entomophilus]NIZ41046.1 DUF4329 domain-containing protein [Entomospira entomophilus]WDI35255.1 DUF4329 domain-containing protein [Entomospira entomophilus]
MDDAAIDFAMTYNGQSIEDNLEYGTSIYETEVKDKDGNMVKKYYYIIPNRGTIHSVKFAHDSNNKDKRVAMIHTHGGYNPGYDGNNFSDFRPHIFAKRRGDIPLADRDGLISYLVTPNGSLKKYDPAKKRDSNNGITTISFNYIPSDPKIDDAYPVFAEDRRVTQAKPDPTRRNPYHDTQKK